MNRLAVQLVQFAIMLVAIFAGALGAMALWRYLSEFQIIAPILKSELGTLVYVAAIGCLIYFPASLLAKRIGAPFPKSDTGRPKDWRSVVTTIWNATVWLTGGIVIMANAERWLAALLDWSQPIMRSVLIPAIGIEFAVYYMMGLGVAICVSPLIIAIASVDALLYPSKAPHSPSP